MKFELSNGEGRVYQWDRDITITITEPESVPEVHFRWGGKAVPLAVTNQQVAIPPELMQLPYDIVFWAYTPEHTMDIATVKLQQRQKPADYVYTPTEIKTWEQLDERIKALEDGGGVAGVSSVNGQTGAVTITAAGLGALTKDDLQSATDKALAQAKESGAFDGAPGAGLDVTSAAVGQIVKIAAVDDNGVPTAWSPVDMPSGGGSGIEKIAEYEASDAVVSIAAEFEQPYRFVVIVDTIPTDSDTTTTAIRITATGATGEGTVTSTVAYANEYLSSKGTFPRTRAYLIIPLGNMTLYAATNKDINNPLNANNVIAGYSNAALENISAISYSSANPSRLFPIGTKIKIYGVRA